MSKIKALLAQSAVGVEFRALGEVGVFTRGNGLQKKDLVDDGIGAIHYGQIFTTYGATTSTTRSFVTPAIAAQLRRAKPGNLVIATTSENDEDVCKAVAWLGDSEIVVSGDSYVFAHSLDPSYVSYYFQTEQFHSQKRRHVSGTKVRRVSGADLARIRIPVPALRVQQEIVSILNKFTRLDNEVQAELALRRTQRLALAKNFAASLRTAEEQGTFSRVALGSLTRESVNPVKVQPGESYRNLGVRWNGGGVLAREPRDGAAIKASTLFRVRSGQLVYNRMFVVEGSFAIVPEEYDRAVVSAEFPLFDIDTSKVVPRWLLHQLCDPYTLKRIEREVTGTERGTMKSRRRWQADQFANFEIILPSFEVQRDSAACLEASSDLIRSLEDERSARQRQYAFYRDRLLTFGELAA